MNKQLKTFAKIVAAMATTMAFAGHASAGTNLLSDGDFEAFSAQVASNSYTVYSAGSKVGAWTVGGDSVDLVRGIGGAISGISVDLAGYNSGSLSQTFNAQAGSTYTLSWDYFKNANGATLSVDFGGKNTTYAPPSAVTSASLTFTAVTSGVQTVTFGSIGNTAAGPVLDNVSLTVSAVPEPETYALLLAGLGAVGFVARRRGSSGSNIR